MRGETEGGRALRHTTPLVSVVVPSRTGRIDGLRAQLNRQTFREWELIVNTSPPTPARARNLGAAQARGELLIFFDDDVQPGQDDLLAQLVDALRTIGSRAALGVPCRLDPAANAFQRRRSRGAFEERIPQTGQRLIEVPWHGAINGRCLAIQRQAFEAVGGFDERLISGEDYELLYRVRRSGGALYALTDRWIYYRPPASRRVVMQKTVWYERGNAQLARKHPESRYRVVLRNPWHAAGYLLARTACLPLLMVLKVSYHHRCPRWAFRPFEALISYLGAWVYCWSWFAEPAARPR